MILGIIAPLSMSVSATRMLLNAIFNSAFHNSTYFFFILFILVTDNELYAGTVADFAGTDPIIYREPLQTEQYDSMSLNGKSIYSYYFVEITPGKFSDHVTYSNCVERT